MIFFFFFLFFLYRSEKHRCEQEAKPSNSDGIRGAEQGVKESEEHRQESRILAVRAL